MTAAAASSAVLRDASLDPVQALETGRVTGTATAPTVVSAATELVLATGTKEVAGRGAGAKMTTTISLTAARGAGARMMTTTSLTTRPMWSAGISSEYWLRKMAALRMEIMI